MSTAAARCRCGHVVHYSYGAPSQTIACPVCQSSLRLPRVSSNNRGGGGLDGSSGLFLALGAVGVSVAIGLAIVALLTIRQNNDSQIAGTDGSVELASNDPLDRQSRFDVDVSASELSTTRSNDGRGVRNLFGGDSDRTQSYGNGPDDSGRRGSIDDESFLAKRLRRREQFRSRRDGQPDDSLTSIASASSTHSSLSRPDRDRRRPGGNDSDEQDAEKDAPLSFSELIQRVEPSVVRIDVESAGGDGIGSGFAVDDEGLIVTNYHVIRGATAMTVRNANGQTVAVEGYLWFDPQRDLALLRVPVDRIELKSLPIAAGLPKVGSPVASFGSPLGFDFTAAEGVVSGIRDRYSLKQSLAGLGMKDADLPGGNTDMKWIQTTAAISGGNSGGPLVDFQGRLVGVNTWTIPSGQNLNFAVAAGEVASAISTVGTKVKPWRSLPKSTRRTRSGRPRSPLDDERLVPSDEMKFVRSDHPGAVRQWQVGDDAITSLAVSEDNKRIAITSLDGSHWVIDRQTGRSVFQIDGGRSEMVANAFASRSSRLYTMRHGDDGSAVSVRNGIDGKEVGTGELEFPLAGHCSDMAVSRDGRSIFACWQNSVVNLWRFDPRLARYDFTGLIDMRMRSGIHGTSADFSPDGLQLAVGASNGWLSIAQVSSTPFRKTNQEQLFLGSINDVIFCDKDCVLACDDAGTVVRCTRLADRRMRVHKLLENSGSGILAMDFDQVRDRLAMVRYDGGVEWWNTKARRRLDDWQPYTAAGTCLTLTADGKYVLAGFSDGKVLMYSTSGLDK